MVSEAPEDDKDISDSYACDKNVLKELLRLMIKKDKTVILSQSEMRMKIAILFKRVKN